MIFEGAIKYVFLGLILGSISPSCFASNCNSSFVEFKEWEKFNQQSRTLPVGTIAERANILEQEWNLRQKAASEIAYTYFASNYFDIDFFKCLQGRPEYQPFLYNLNDAFYIQGINFFEQSGVPSFLKFAQLMKVQKQLLFEVSAKPPVPGAPEKAGFDRGLNAIYLNLTDIQPNEWLLIFSHEMIHSLDVDLANADLIFNNQQLAHSVFEWATRNGGDISNKVVLNEVDSWLVAGLNRGLLAEYRAWVVTFSIYLKGRRSNIFSEVPWLEGLLSQKKAGETLEKFTMRFLDSRFTNPTSGIFSNKPVADRINYLRTQIRNNPPSVNGELGRIYQNMQR